MGNLYDQLEIDIAAKHRALDDDPASRSALKHRRGFFRRVFDQGLFYLGLYEKLIDSGFYRAWFKEFNEYWTLCLGGRPLKFHDFFWLYSSYRTRFAAVVARENAGADEFLRAWQDPRNIYAVFGAVYKYALSPWQYWPFRRCLTPGARVLEYGAGIAPITAGLLNDGRGRYDFTVADLPQFTFHFAKWRLKQFGVRFINLESDRPPSLSGLYDVIFLMTVIEHLPNPREVIKQLTAHLKPGGYLCFDYILSGGGGLDTAAAIKDRADVLRFIERHYTVESGSLKYNESMGRTVARRNSVGVDL